MSDEFFGEMSKPEGSRPILVRWPLHALNSLEGELIGLMRAAEMIEEHRAPMVWIEDDEFKNADEWSKLYGPLSAVEAMTMRDLIYGEVQERFRRQIIIARELGPSATLDLYLVACEFEGIPPMLERTLT